MDILQFVRREAGSEKDITISPIYPPPHHTSDLPLFLWGAGGLARRVYAWLAENRIALAGVFIDDRPKEPGQESEKFHGLEVYGLEDVAQKYREFNVIVGHSQGYHMMDDLKLRYKNIRNVYALDLVVLLGLEPIPYDFVVENKSAFEWTYGQFSDELSKAGYLAALNAKINNNPKYLAPYVRPDEYFCEDIIKLGSDEIFIDCGAFDGDTVTSFLSNLNDRSIQGYSAIYALEPDKTNYKKLLNKVGLMPNVHCLNKGAWSEATTLRFDSSGDVASHVQDSGETVIETTTIDNLLSGKRASLIKMDIEGAELEGLKGARRTISQYKPKLAVCAYHKPSDLIMLPQYIKSIVPEYNLFFRLHSWLTIDFVLYAVGGD